MTRSGFENAGGNSLEEKFTLAHRMSIEAGKDGVSLHAHVKLSNARLASLPPKPQRSKDQQAEASRIHEGCRILRRNFMSHHARWIYNELTEDLREYKTLQELVYGASEICPGLVPTISQIEEERTRPQPEKEGYEIDQGIFFHYLLRDEEIGTHIYASALRATQRALDLLPLFRKDGYLNLGTVTIERTEGAAYVTINNQNCLNAEDDALVEDLETAIDLALLDEDVQVGVLRGGFMEHPRYLGRRVFSAGINLKALHAGKISFVDFLLRREFGLINKIFRGLLHGLSPNANGTSPMSDFSHEKPWIAIVDSFAIGGGAQLLLVFDYVIAADDSYFSLPAAQEGIVPGMANLRLRRLTGSRISRQLVLCGRKIQAQDADARFIFDEVIPNSSIEAAMEKCISYFRSPAVRANRHMINFNEESPADFLRYAAEFVQVQANRLYSEDVLAKIFRR